MQADARDSNKNASKSNKNEKKEEEKKGEKKEEINNTKSENSMMDYHPLSNRAILANTNNGKCIKYKRPEITLPTEDSKLCNRTILADASDILVNKDKDTVACACEVLNETCQTTNKTQGTKEKVLKMKYNNEKIKPYFLEYLNEQKSSTYLDEIKDYFNSAEFITDFYSKYRKVKQVEEYEEKFRNVSICPSNLIYCRDEIPKGLFAIPMEAYALTLDDTETSRNLNNDSNHSTSEDEYSLHLESKCSTDDDEEDQSRVKNQQSNSSCLIASADVDPQLKMLLQEICYGSDTKEGTCTQISCKQKDFTKQKYDENFTEVNTGDRLVINCDSTCCRLRKVREPNKSNETHCEVKNDCLKQSDKNQKQDFQSILKQLEKNHHNTMKVIKAAASDVVDYFSWPSNNDSSLGKTFQKIITNPEQCRKLFEAKKLEDSCGTKIMVESDERFVCESNSPIFKDPSMESRPQPSCKPKCVEYPPNDDDPLPIKESLQNFCTAVYDASSNIIDEGKKLLGIESEEDKDPIKRIQRSAEKIAKEVSKTAEEFKNMTPEKKAAVIKMGADTVVEKVKDKTENMLKDFSHKTSNFASGKQKEVYRTNSQGRIEKVTPIKGVVKEEAPEEECYDCSVTKSMNAVFNSLMGKDENTPKESTSIQSPREVAMNSEGQSSFIMQKITNITDAVISYFFDDKASSEDTVHSTVESDSNSPSKYNMFKKKESEP